MRTRIALLTLVFLAASAVGPGCPKRRGDDDSSGSTEAATPATPTGPSVLLITLDTTRADRLGCYGNEQGATPFLDRIAADGVRFRRAFAHTPLTIPSHVTIFTGQYPDRHGVRDNGDHFLGDDAVTLAEQFHDAGYATVASVGAYVTQRKWGFGQGFDDYFDRLDSDVGILDNQWRAERRGRLVADDLVGWFEQHPDEPFFAWMHLFDPHDPYEPPPPYDERFPGQPYLGEVAYMDAQVGVVLEALEHIGADRRTAVVVVGDHGEAFGNHGEVHHGLFVYNATMHVPFLIRPAGGAEPRVIDEAVGLVDVAPTVLALAGLPPAAEGTHDGIDLSSALVGIEPPRRALYGESLYVRHHFGWSEQRMIVEWPYKYIGSTRPELFDIAADPVERVELSADRSDVALRLQAALDARATVVVETATEAVDPDTAQRLQALGYVATRVEVADGAVLPDPKDKLPVLASISRGTAALRAGQFREARDLLRQVVAEEPELIDPRVALAQAHANLGDLEGALAELQQAEARAPNSSEVHALQAAVLVALGRQEEAMARLEEALAVDDKDPQVWGQTLRILFESRRYPQVIEQADRAAAVLPDSHAIHGYRGAALVALGRLDEGRPELDRALAGGHEPPWAHFAMGVIEDADGDAEASLSHFLAEHAAYPEHLEALAAAVLQLVRTGRNADVEEYAQRCLAADSQQPRMHWAVGQAQFNLGRYDDAATSIDSCLALAPDDAECTMLLANVQSKQGKKDEAELTFQRALELAREAHPGAQVDGVRKF